MSRGYPDFYRGFEIYGGAVRIKVFPGWGHAQRSTYDDTPTLNDYEDLITLSGQGIFFGGRMQIDSTGFPSTDLMKITIDGNIFEEITCLKARDVAKGGAIGTPIKLVLVNELKKIYQVDLRGDFTFESSFVFSYKSLRIATTNVELTCFYALAA